MAKRQANLHAIQSALRLPLPGYVAQATMAPRPRPGGRPDLPQSCPHKGAVLILLYPKDGQLVIPLTRRTESVELHKGQISLPGGSREPEDADFAHTALREACEELGVEENAIRLLGALTPLYIPVSRFCVYPFVGHTPVSFPLRPDPREVAEVLETPIDHLLDPAARSVEMHVRDGQDYEIPAYNIAGQKVWGATAMILAEFLAVLRTAQAA